ncbi:peptidase dimerization domain-containing protein [Pseudomonas sp. BN102]|uniref:peptidase dimerization domain-containing protein n=1 Tax=Pseudomonas sp. BN102 TaxID=2567886 RepID=UPI002455A0C7|nr:peptidase dimerization domain-containing protein [Pseudomonas sp. BN102]MDH4611386.1 hypothetical protein [Pseudomonas sp. BN102]
MSKRGPRRAINGVPSCSSRRLRAWLTAGWVIGVVTGGQAICWLDIRVKGQAAHASTTPMPLRRDALFASAEMIQALEQLAVRFAPSGLVTIGQLEIAKSSRNTIPGSLQFTLDLRNPDDQVLARMEREARELIAAIAAQFLRQGHSRVAVLDTDMHHGQGIQEIFYTCSDVLYVSIHGDPTNFYPVVAGFEDERGSGAGEGFNLNLPMPHGASEALFLQRLEEAAAAVKDFGAEVLVLSLGFDIYQEDPQAKVAVTAEGFGRLGAAIAAMELPCLVVQEGGYHLESLEDNARRFFNGLLGR